MICYYYLHTNGSIICKRDTDGGCVADFRDSDFVRHFWRLDTDNRGSAWTLVVEAASLGANEERVKQLSELWELDDDAKEFADHIGCKMSIDGNTWCATLPSFVNLQDSPAGFGETPVQAFAELARALGFKASKMWGHSLKTLIEKCVTS